MMYGIKGEGTTSHRNQIIPAEYVTPQGLTFPLSQQEQQIFFDGVVNQNGNVI